MTHPQNLTEAVVRLRGDGEAPWTVVHDDGGGWIQIKLVGHDGKSLTEGSPRDDVEVIPPGTYCLKCCMLFKPYTNNDPHTHEDLPICSSH